MTDWPVQLAMVRLAEAIRQLPDGAAELQVRSSFLQLVERLQDAVGLLTREWDVGGFHLDTTLWTVTDGDRETSAVLRQIEDYGYEVRILIDGELRQARFFRNDRDAALAFARTRRGGLEMRGWMEKPEARLDLGEAV